MLCCFVRRGIVKEMGLTGRITPDQVAKKWDNLKTKFKVTPCAARRRSASAAFDLLTCCMLSGSGWSAAPVSPSCVVDVCFL